MCILKMDHHCPWILNCVGFKNHKYFFLLILYVALDCQFITWTMLESVRRAVASSPSVASMFLLLFGETLAACIGLIACVFLSFHVWLMLKGMTTIEFLEKVNRKRGRRTSPYDLGLLRNVQAVLGENPLFWLLPCSPPPGKGVSFQRHGSCETGGLVGDMENGQDRHGRRRHPKHGQAGASAQFPPPYGSVY
jgi:hypothetical protein